MTAPTESTVTPASTVPAGPIISFHAQQRMTRLRISRVLVDRTLADPELTWPGRDGCIELVGSHVIVTLAPHDNIVVTVKLRTAIPYQNGVHDLHNPRLRPAIDSATR